MAAVLSFAWASFRSTANSNKRADVPQKVKHLLSFYFTFIPWLIAILTVAYAPL
jgi:hypothetical protein